MNTRMKALLTLGIGASLLAGPSTAQIGPFANNAGSRIRSATQVNLDEPNLHGAMRKLWEDHVTWTRLFIVSTANDLSNSPATKARLLKNQVDLGNAIKPIYGETAGNRLSALLKEHILTAAEVITAAKLRDSDTVSYQKDRWFENGNQIADLLSESNPSNWGRIEMRSMMREHIETTFEEAQAELSGDYVTSVRKYDQVRIQILKMADMMSLGITNQFPNRFSSNPYAGQTVLAGNTLLRMDAGTVIPFRLNQQLSSNGSSVGDRFTANVDTGDSMGYQGMTSGAVLEGHVDVARAKSGKTPGVLGLAFDRLRMPDGRTYAIYGSLIGLDSKSVTNDNGRLVAKSAAKNDNLKYVGYGAGGGALLAVLTKGNVITNSLICGALGYLYGEIQKSPAKSRNVTSEIGTRFGVRLTRELSYRGIAVENR
ncbi:MAG: hypothetical protein HZC36_13805 [Armatimonadetes bacterium]|nr:hypothetical protein [Armatimonadota bacterium]